MNRKDYLLKLIVEYFIKKAVPVGSHTLIEEFNLEYSSATIRGDMSTLEKEGYIEKTHTSSGRVPSSKGYQYYYNNLRDRSLNDEIKLQIQTIIDQKVASVEQILKESCEVLSHMTNLASIVIGPNNDDEKLVSIKIIPLSEKSATAVFVTNKGFVENKTFVFNENVRVEDIERCVTLFEERLKGTAIVNIVEKMQSIKPILSEFIIEHDIMYQAFMQVFIKFASDRLELYGKEHLLSQPEYDTDAKKIKRILELIGNSKEVTSLIESNNQSEEQLTVSIGGTDGEEDISIVSAKIDIEGLKKGTISVVGPKRMDYDNVATLLEFVANELNRKYRN